MRMIHMALGRIMTEFITFLRKVIHCAIIHRDLKLAVMIYQMRTRLFL